MNAAPLAPTRGLLLFAITQVTRLGLKKKKEKKRRKRTKPRSRGGRRRKQGRQRRRRRRRSRRRSRRRKSRKEKEETNETAPSLEPWNRGPSLSQSDLFRLVAASMRGHSNLAIFARANLKKHERLTRAKMLLITGAAACNACAGRRKLIRASAQHRQKGLFSVDFYTGWYPGAIGKPAADAYSPDVHRAPRVKTAISLELK